MYQARRNLEKYGWKEGYKIRVDLFTYHVICATGKGLGKNEAGIVHAIKVPLKTDTSGVL